MSNIDLAISEFGRAIDMAGLKLDGNDLLCLQLDGSDALMFEKLDDALLVSLVRPVGRFRDGLLEQALELCHPRHEHPFQPRAGLTTDERLVLSLRLAGREVQLASLDQGIKLLMRLFDRLED